MYESHFGLRHRPFRPAPDVARYYPASGHEQALAQLAQALADDEGLALVTGEPGCGKTLLCHCLVQRAGEARSAFVGHGPFPDRASLLQAVLYDLSLPYEGRTEQELRLALTDDLLRHAAEGGPTLLVVDEAHHLRPDLLEELRLLANLEGAAGRALQVVLAGQPSLLGVLSRPGLASLRQRLAVRATVAALAPAEAADYLLHHLRAACDRPERVMTGEALEVLAHATRGVPRLLNQAAHRALVLAHGAGAGAVDAEAALEALAALGIAAEDEASGAGGDGLVRITLVGGEAGEGGSIGDAAPPADGAPVYATARLRSA